jgi:hypothetical protein
MWFKWTISQTRTPARERPVFWWHQLESESRAGLPFAHLFPRPPASRRKPLSEARRLVSELVAADPPERMEEIVHAYQYKPPKRNWEPVELWQILSINRLDDAECAAWGDDGSRVVEWFDRGELLSAWPATPIPQMAQESTPRGFGRIVAWLKGLIPDPKSDSLELVGAEY